MAYKDLFPFRSHWLNIDGHRYHYIDQGPKDAMAVVMVHGNPTWSFYYRTLIPAIAEKYRVIVPDHLGCGLSDKPQDYAYTIGQHTENLHRLIVHLQLNRILWVVHDWGGAIGMGCASKNEAATQGFVVFNTAAFMFPHIPYRIQICRPRILGALLVRGLNLFAAMAILMGTAQSKRFTADVKSGYLHPYSSWQNRIAIHRFVQEIPLESDHHNQHLLETLDTGLSRFKNHPMRIFWGAKDFCFTKKHVLPEWRRRFPKAQVTVFDDAGHYVVEDAHEKILPLMKSFIQEIDCRDRI